jgi:hypothetical protein
VLDDDAERILVRDPPARRILVCAANASALAAVVSSSATGALACPAVDRGQLGSKPAGRRLRLQVGCRQLVRARTARAVAELAARVDRGGGPVDGAGEASDKETRR